MCALRESAGFVELCSKGFFFWSLLQLFWGRVPLVQRGLGRPLPRRERHFLS